jgi:subtilisin family serine protease
VSNTGLAAATQASFIDPIPANTTFAYTVSPPSLVYNEVEDRIEWTGTVSSQEQVDLTFVVTATGGCGAQITNTATITDPKIPTTVTVQSVTTAWDLFYYAEDFERDDGGYTVEGSYPSWEWGRPVSGPKSSRSGTRAWATNLSGDYNLTEDSYLISPVIDLSNSAYVNGHPLWLEWWDWFRSESCCDYGVVEARGQGTHWIAITPQFRGNLEGWDQHAIDISEYAGADDFQIRFRLHSDLSSTREGWYVDDVAIYQCQPPPGLHLGPDGVEASGCVGLEQRHSFHLANWTGSEGTFDLTSHLAQPGWGTIEGPDSLTLAEASGASFVVTMTPEVCLPNGTQLRATIDAWGNGYTGTAHITKTLTTGTTAQWSTAPDAPQGTRFHAVAHHKGHLYHIGGETSWWLSTDSVHRYDPASDLWSAVAPLPSARYGMDAVTIDDHIYVPGGSDDMDDTGDGGTFLDELLVYDPASNSWSTAAPMPVALAYASAVSIDSKLYVIGGEQDDGTYVRSLYIYDPGSDSWSEGAPMSQPRAYAGAAAIGDKIYVAGGFAGSSTVHNSLEIYDPATDSWTDGPNLPRPWAPFGDAALSNRYFAIYSGGTISYSAGRGTQYDCSQDAYSFDTLSRQWVVLPVLSECLYGSQGVTTGDRLYRVSGRARRPVWHMTPRVEYLQACPTCQDLGWLEGTVYDYDMAGGTCTDATVHIGPGGRVIPASTSGNYTATLEATDFVVTARAGSYPKPDGPYTVAVSAGETTSQDFVLDRPDIAVAPLSLTTATTAPFTTTRFLTITNGGTYSLEFQIREVVEPQSIEATSPASAEPEPKAKSQPVMDSPEIQVEPQLLNELSTDPSTGYLIYFRERPDLLPAFEMDWVERGRFVTEALQETASRSQERVRAYLDGQGISYRAYWIDNVISVQSSNRATVNGLQSFPEIKALRARRQSILYKPVEEAAAGPSPTTIESNIRHVAADRVWSELGITGEGIVVANIDTGVRYSHEALVNRYRGNLGSGNFDHNHNWWDPALGGSDPEPNDWHSHGTHTMGTMLGDDGDTNQIGMAPGARWIACQAFEWSDDELLDCGQFMAAPWDLAGDNANPDLRPHIVNNSWGDCLRSSDHWYDDVINSWHALGIYPVFSNGNSSNCGYSRPAGCNSVGNPARAGNLTGVGSTGRDNGLYAPHSNWGPTDDPDTVNPNGFPMLKPQVLAPGVSIRSSTNGGDSLYGLFSGTSMSAPHVSGLIALMWSAAPCLVGDYATTETLIQDTANPIPYPSRCGGEGPGDVPNMAAGWGEIDAYAAVQAATEQCRDDWFEWVETDIVSGTLAPDQDQPIRVTFTCTPTTTELTQPLEGTLQILSDDPCQDSVEIPLRLFCSDQTPTTVWEKEVLVNGIPAGTVEGPHVVRPGDSVVVVDRVGAVFVEPITSSLTETWDESLELVGYDAGSVGSVVKDDQRLTWTLAGVAPNTLYPITKTFEVQHGDWIAGTVAETYVVQDALDQVPDRVIQLKRYRPALRLDKVGPFTARDGEVIQLTLTIRSNDDFWSAALLTDALPLGMTYAGDLTYTHGIAWEQTNAIHWTNDAKAVPPLDGPTQIRVGVLSPDADPLRDLVNLLDGMDGVTAQRISGDLSTMTLEELVPYQLIVTTNNNRWSDAGANPNIGNILADYVDIGGKIIMAGFAWDDPAYGWHLEGRLMDEGHTPYRTSTADLGAASLGLYDPLHPVMQGVAGLAAVGTVRRQALPLEAGATWIADWDDGQPCIYAQGTSVLGYNLLLDWSGAGWPWSGDVPTLLENSIGWLISHAPQPIPPEVKIDFKVQVAGNPGQIIRNTAELDWVTDWTSGAHETLISEAPDVYLPLIHRGYRGY